MRFERLGRRLGVVAAAIAAAMVGTGASIGSRRRRQRI